MRIDERSAAFTALGLARVQRRHVGVVMTSGTAVANAYPAVIEAHMSHTPLAVISADRPERLVGTGASQTIWQQGIFGRYAETQQVQSLDDVHAATFDATQVHINVALDTPLVPEQLPEPVGQPRRVGPGALEGSRGWEDHGVVDVDLTRNTLVIAGDEAWEVPGLEHVPTIAEPTAPTPFHQVHPLAARFFAQSEVAISHDGGDFAADTKPEQVIVVGHPTLHRDVMALLADPDIEVVGISRTETFTGQPDKRGSPNPVRDASFVGMPFDGVDTYSARGAAGIDGTVSQAVGVALATQALRPDEIRAPRTVALMGDLTFLHDANGLLIGPDEPRPGNLTIVVANDDGGGIFEALEPGADNLRGAFERVFGTPHGVDVEKLAEAYGADYRRADTLAELNEVLLELEAQPSPITVVEAATTRTTRRALAARLNR